MATRTTTTSVWVVSYRKGREWIRTTFPDRKTALVEVNRLLDQLPLFRSVYLTERGLPEASSQKKEGRR